MSRYRRARIEGGAFFFTLALADRSSDVLVREIDRLRRAYRITQDRLPFETVADLYPARPSSRALDLAGRRCGFCLALEPFQIRLLTRPPGRAIAFEQQNRQTRERNLATPLLGARRSATTPTWSGTSITSTTIRSSTGLVSRVRRLAAFQLSPLC